jgi:hypothetical protein
LHRRTPFYWSGSLGGGVADFNSALSSISSSGPTGMARRISTGCSDFSFVGSTGIAFKIGLPSSDF